MDTMKKNPGVFELDNSDVEEMEDAYNILYSQFHPQLELATFM